MRFAFLLGTAVHAAEPNPPNWPSSVLIMDEHTPNLSKNLQQLYDELTFPIGKFSDRRLALLFKPGTYDIDVPVGYYTQVLGLGRQPEDVTFTGERGIFGPSQGSGNNGGTNFDTFWKGAENIANHPRCGKTVWSVSQAAPLRRMSIRGDLLFGQYNQSAPDPVSRGSGGFSSNLKVTGNLDFTLQQQWCLRNSELGGSSYYNASTRAANFVFVGTTGAPEQTLRCTDTGINPTSPSPQQLVADAAPVSVEKPYIIMDSDGKFNLVTPQAKRFSVGAQWDEGYVDSFDRVFVATNETATSEINAKLAEGLHVVLTPGVYRLQEPIRIAGGKSHQVLLGLGLATLIPTTGLPAVEVADASGVRVAGLLLQAGPQRSEALIRFGSDGQEDGANPGLMADIFARVGGEDPQELVQARMMAEVNASHAVLDNIWLWRADCCTDFTGGCGSCGPRLVDHGIVVNGDSVTAYGLAAEHTQSDITVWNGEAGAVYFYQAEMDSFAHTDGDDTPDYGPNGVSGYRVNAKEHYGFGVGVYAYFNQPGIRVRSGIVVSHQETEGTFVCPFKWDLNPSWFENLNSTIEEAIRVEPGSMSAIVV
jgi:hypothetical protein